MDISGKFVSIFNMSIFSKLICTKNNTSKSTECNDGFDRSVIYYKIIGANYGSYPYELGLNTLAKNNEKFNEAPVCGPGGLYFCDIKHIFGYMNYGNKLCILTIPDDAQVIKIDSKYKSDQIYIKEIIEINYNTIKYLIECGADVTARDNYLFYYAACKGYLGEMVRYLERRGANINAGITSAALYAVRNGCPELVKYLKTFRETLAQ